MPLCCTASRFCTSREPVGTALTWRRLMTSCRFEVQQAIVDDGAVDVIVCYCSVYDARARSRYAASSCRKPTGSKHPVVELLDQGLVRGPVDQHVVVVEPGLRSEERRLG